MPISRLLRNLALLALLFVATACGAGAALSELQIEPHTTISPNADGVADLTRLHYRVGTESTVTMLFRNAAGEEFPFREAVRRPAGDYELLFAGVVDGRVLPNGSYDLIARAEPINGDAPVELSTPLTIEEAVTAPPQIENFAITPRTITPNRDGIRDEVAISYALSRPVSRMDVYLLGPDGTRYPVPPATIGDPLAAGGHTQRYDGGAGLEVAPPPDGTYTVVAEAYDAIGANSRVTGTLEIAMGGVPQVEITRHQVEWSSEVLSIGETLRFTTTVTNVGSVPIRTHGPASGTRYDSGANYNNFAAPISDGAWRLGLDFEGNPVYNGRRYPYRWQLGTDDELTEIDGERYLMPDQSVTVRGELTLSAMPPREVTGFWVGLLHENVRFVEDYVDTTYITIEGTPDAPQLIATPTVTE